jgi:hypothetical protein
MVYLPGELLLMQKMLVVIPHPFLQLKEVLLLYLLNPLFQLEIVLLLLLFLVDLGEEVLSALKLHLEIVVLPLFL